MKEADIVQAETQKLVAEQLRLRGQEEEVLQEIARANETGRVYEGRGG